MLTFFCFFFCFQEKIEAINQTLVNEYEVRRKMLLKRLDVTVQSFGWSDRAKVHSSSDLWQGAKLFKQDTLGSEGHFGPAALRRDAPNVQEAKAFTQVCSAVTPTWRKRMLC